MEKDSEVNKTVGVLGQVRYFLLCPLHIFQLNHHTLFAITQLYTSQARSVPGAVRELDLARGELSIRCGIRCFITSPADLPVELFGHNPVNKIW